MIVCNHETALRLHVCNLSLRHILKSVCIFHKDVCLTYQLREGCPIADYASLRRGPVTVLIKDGLETLRFPPHRWSKFVCDCIRSIVRIELRNTGINVGKPAFHICLVLKYRFDGELIIWLLVQIGIAAHKA